MGNVRSGNTWYVDTAGSLVPVSIASTVGLQLYQVVLTPTSANASIVLGDDLNGYVKLDLRTVTANESKIARFWELPITFTNGIRVISIANAVATLIVQDIGK